jgi:hypothetical protein
MRTRLWTEVKQAKFNSIYINLYEKRQRNLLKWYNVIILLFSTSGILGWNIWDPYSVIICTIISIMSLIKLLQSQFLMSETQLSKFDSISGFYTNYYNRLERLWYDYESSIINEEQMKVKFYELVDSESSINKPVNELIRNKPKAIFKNAVEETNNWFKNVFNT